MAVRRFRGSSTALPDTLPKAKSLSPLLAQFERERPLAEAYAKQLEGKSWRELLTEQHRPDRPRGVWADLVRRRAWMSIPSSPEFEEQKAAWRRRAEEWKRQEAERRQRSKETVAELEKQYNEYYLRKIEEPAPPGPDPNGSNRALLNELQRWIERGKVAEKDLKLADGLLKASRHFRLTGRQIYHVKRLIHGLPKQPPRKREVRNRAAVRERRLAAAERKRAKAEKMG
jgi:hypothetical protein